MTLTWGQKLMLHKAERLCKAGQPGCGCLRLWAGSSRQGDRICDKCQVPHKVPCLSPSLRAQRHAPLLLPAPVAVPCQAALLGAAGSQSHLAHPRYPCPIAPGPARCWPSHSFHMAITARGLLQLIPLGGLSDASPSPRTPPKQNQPHQNLTSASCHLPQVCVGAREQRGHPRRGGRMQPLRAPAQPFIPRALLPPRPDAQFKVENGSPSGWWPCSCGTCGGDGTRWPG